ACQEEPKGRRLAPLSARAARPDWRRLPASFSDFVGITDGANDGKRLKNLVLPVGIEPTTSPLPRECSTTELRQHPCPWIVLTRVGANTRGCRSWQGRRVERHLTDLRLPDPTGGNQACAFGSRRRRRILRSRQKKISLPLFSLRLAVQISLIPEADS